MTLVEITMHAMCKDGDFVQYVIENDISGNYIAGSYQNLLEVARAVLGNVECAQVEYPEYRITLVDGPLPNGNEERTLKPYHGIKGELSTLLQNPALQKEARKRVAALWR